MVWPWRIWPQLTLNPSNNDQSKPRLSVDVDVVFASPFSVLLARPQGQQCATIKCQTGAFDGRLKSLHLSADTGAGFVLWQSANGGGRKSGADGVLGVSGVSARGGEIQVTERSYKHWHIQDHTKAATHDGGAGAHSV